MHRGPGVLLSILVGANGGVYLQSDIVLKAGLGGDNHLAVLLQSYTSTVRCKDSDVPWSREACAMIQGGMKADDKQRLFGDSFLDPAVEEDLPLELVSSEATHPAMPILESLC